MSIRDADLGFFAFGASMFCNSFFSQMQMKLKALGYFVRKFEAQPAEEYLRRTGY